jgi:hypothetical protein
VIVVVVHFLILSFRPDRVVRTATLRASERAALEAEEWWDSDEEGHEDDASDATRPFSQNNRPQRISYQHTLTVATMIHNHRPRLREWIEFYQLMAVEHFLIYDYQSTDLPLEILQPYIDAGNVTYITWPPEKNPRPQRDGSLQAWKADWLRESLTACRAANWPIHPQKPCQYSAFADAIERTSNHVSRWLGVLEIEDFIFPGTTSKYDTLRDLLAKEHSAHDIVTIRGSTFGTNGFVESGPHGTPGSPLPGLITETHTRREDHSCISRAVSGADCSAE